MISVSRKGKRFLNPLLTRCQDDITRQCIDLAIMSLEGKKHKLVSKKEAHGSGPARGPLSIQIVGLLRATQMKIAALIATRTKPQNVVAIIESMRLLATGDHELEFLVAVDDDDSTNPHGFLNSYPARQHRHADRRGPASRLPERMLETAWPS